jgi:hypothetical protein
MTDHASAIRAAAEEIGAKTTAFNVLSNDAIAAIIARHLPAPEWRAIDDAARNGDDWLVLLPTGVRCVASFEGGCWIDSPRGTLLLDDPARYMPLPPPPQGEK